MRKVISVFLLTLVVILGTLNVNAEEDCRTKYVMNEPAPARVDSERDCDRTVVLCNISPFRLNQCGFSKISVLSYNGCKEILWSRAMESGVSSAVKGAEWLFPDIVAADYIHATDGKK